MPGDKQAGRFLDPEEVHEVDAEQIEYMLKQGFRPYRTAHGRLKWITPGQHGYRRLHTSASGHMHRSFFQRIFGSMLSRVVAVLVTLLLVAIALYVGTLLF